MDRFGTVPSWHRHRTGADTYYGIGSAVAHIVDALLHDQRAILTICARITGVPECDGLTLALPHLVGGAGVLATIPWRST